MGRVGAPPPVRGIISAVFSDRDALAEATSALAAELGAVELLGDEMSFDHTDYYEAEMGPGLRRCFLEIAGLAPPDALVSMKTFTREVEQRFTTDGRRRINLDPGILSRERFVLASTKNAPRRLYLGQGIHAELTLVYESGDFQAQPWTYPDYASAPVRALLRDARRRYLAELKERDS